jgi:hypothetical protein
MLMKTSNGDVVMAMSVFALLPPFFSIKMIVILDIAFDTHRAISTDMKNAYSGNRQGVFQSVCSGTFFKLLKGSLRI